MDLHDYIITGIIVGIIIFQLIAFSGNIKKISNYKKTIEQAKNFEIIEVEVPEDWIRDIEVHEILNDPDGFSESSAKYSNKVGFVEEVNLEEKLTDQVENNNTEIEQDEEIHAAYNDFANEGPNPVELNFPDEEPQQEYEIEEFEEDDFIFEDEKDSKTK
jgi:DNA-directed RNA polymerase subunit delta